MRSSFLFILLASFASSSRLSKEENAALQKDCSLRFRRMHNGIVVPSSDVVGQSAVAIVVEGEGENRGVCTGTLISSRHILTASHCFAKHQCHSSKAKIRVHVGAQFIDDADSKGTVIGISNYTSFPGYFPDECKGISKIGMDITVVELADDVRNGLTSIACLPASVEVPKEWTGYGFGDNDGELGRLNMIKWTFAECPGNKTEDAKVICARPLKFDQNGCFGDSGHGAVDSGAGVKPVLYGVFSNGTPCDQLINEIELRKRGKIFKKPKQPERFVSVYHYKKFICEVSGVCA